MSSNQFIFIFDGQKPPCKSELNQKRDEKRLNYTTRANKLAEEYNDDPEIIEKFKRYSEYASETLIYLFIDFLAFKKFKFMISPYEAESQLAYLYFNKDLDYVMSEDSDLIAFGCTEILRQFKMTETLKYFSFNNLVDESSDTERAFVKLGLFNRLRHASSNLHHDWLRLPQKSQGNRVSYHHVNAPNS